MAKEEMTKNRGAKRARLVAEDPNAEMGRGAVTTSASEYDMMVEEITSQPGSQVADIPQASDDGDSDGDGLGAEESQEELGRPSSSNHDIRNREGADFDFQISRSEDEDDDHNYSITSRWKQRMHIWKSWAGQDVDNFDLNSLQLLSGEDLFMVIDDKSQLGRGLVKFEKSIKASKEKITTWEEEITTWEEEITTWEAFAGEESNKSANGFVHSLIGKNNTLIEKNNTLIEKEKGLVGKYITTVDTLIEKIYSAHHALKNKFSYLKAKGNESLLTITSQMKSLDVNRFDKTKVPSPSEFDQIVPETRDRFRENLMSQLDECEKEMLCDFQGFVLDLFVNAIETDDEEMVKHTTDAILEWKSGEKVNLATDGSGALTKQYARPPTTNDKEETAGHPILLAVICRIIRIIVECSQKKIESVLNECEHGVSTEKRLAGSNQHHSRERRIDIVANLYEEFLPLLQGTIFQKPIEIKIFPGLLGKLRKVLEKGRSQIVGHQAKRLQYYFDFGGAGKDSHSVGICLTHLTIEVIRMELSSVGTTDVTLDVFGTGCLPLLGTKLLTPEQLSVLESCDNNGFLLLAGALKLQSLEEFSVRDISVKQILPSEEDLNIQSYLGSGAFSNVVNLGSGNFMKIPKSSSQAKSLIREAEILQILQRGSGSSVIPRPVLLGEIGGSISSIETTIGCEISCWKGLRLNGVVGFPLHRLPKNDWDKHATYIITEVYNALVYAHMMSIYHLDLRPGNIIVELANVGEPEQQCKVMLSDWGCSVDGKSTQVLGAFHGCTPYAHDRLLGDFEGRLGSDLDFASLAYTVDHVLHRRLRWIFQFDRPTNVGSDDLGLRRECVAEWLSINRTTALQNLSQHILNAMRSACGVCGVENAVVIESSSTEEST